MADPRDPHAWCRGALPFLQSGLLSESEEARLRAHLRDCERCRSELEGLMETPDPAAAEHIPAGIVASWNDARQSLRGLTRALVRHHLERCAQCRQDLEALGFEPILPVVPDLEPSDATDEIGAGTDSPSPSPPAEVHPIRIVTARSRGAAWLLGGWAAAASVVVGLLVFSARGVHEPATTGPAPPPPVPAATLPPSLSLEMVGDASLLEPPTRGGRSEQVVVVPAGAHSMSLRFAPLDVPDDAEVRVELRDARGAVVAAGDYRQRQLYPRKGLIVSSGRDTLAEGAYVLHVAGHGAGSTGPEEMDLPFRVAIDRPAGRPPRR